MSNLYFTLRQEHEPIKQPAPMEPLFLTILQALLYLFTAIFLIFIGLRIRKRFVQRSVELSNISVLPVRIEEGETEPLLDVC
jgi:hypothetical protein